MENRKITVSTEVHAPIEKVWTYWTEPEHIVNWNHASPDWHCPKASNDLKEAGKFSYTMAAKDGSVSFDFEGVYDEIDKHKQIAYSMVDGRQVKVFFEQKGNITQVTEIFDPETINTEDLQRSGWQAILDNFKDYVENS